MARRVINKLSDMQDWPTTPDSRYAQLAEQNVFAQPITIGALYRAHENNNGDAQRFDDNDSSYPSGWTEEDAALQTDTNTLNGFWYISGTNSETSNAYYKMMTGTVASWQSYQFDSVFYRDGQFTDDMDYYFGLYKNNGSDAPDTDFFIRCNLHWDSTNSKWQVRGEMKDGTTQTNGAYIDLNAIPQQPLYFRVNRRASSDTVRAYVGLNYISDSHTQLLSDSLDRTQWGNAILRVSMSRGNGVQNYLYLSGIDASGAV